MLNISPPQVIPYYRNVKEQYFRNYLCEDLPNKYFLPYPKGEWHPFVFTFPLGAVNLSLQVDIKDLNGNIVVENANLITDASDGVACGTGLGANLDLECGYYYMCVTIKYENEITRETETCEYVFDPIEIVEDECCLHTVEFFSKRDQNCIPYESKNFVQRFYLQEKANPIQQIAEPIAELIENEDSTTTTKSYYLPDQYLICDRWHYVTYAKLWQIIAGEDCVNITTSTGLKCSMKQIQAVATQAAGSECLYQLDITFNAGMCYKNTGCKNANNGLKDLIKLPYKDCDTESCKPPLLSVRSCTESTINIDIQQTDVDAIGSEYLIVGSSSYSPTTTPTSLSLESLNECTSYQIWIRSLCLNAEGNTIYSPATTITVTTKTRECPIPVITDCTESQNGILFELQTSGTYCYEYRLKGTVNWTNQTDFTGNTINITGLADNTLYEFNFWRKCTGQKITESEKILIEKQTTECRISADIQTTAVTCNDDGSLTVINVNSSNSTATELILCDNLGGVIATSPSILNGGSFTFTNLSSGGYILKLDDKVCIDTISINILNDSSCGVPLNVAVTDLIYTLEGCTVLLNWDAPTNVTFLSNYKVWYKKFNETTWIEWVDNPTDATGAEIIVPECDTAYDFRVNACCENGCQSDFAYLQTPYSVPCSPCINTQIVLSDLFRSQTNQGNSGISDTCFTLNNIDAFDDVCFASANVPLSDAVFLPNDKYCQIDSDNVEAFVKVSCGGEPIYLGVFGTFPNISQVLLLDINDTKSVEDVTNDLPSLCCNANKNNNDANCAPQALEVGTPYQDGSNYCVDILNAHYFSYINIIDGGGSPSIVYDNGVYTICSASTSQSLITIECKGNSYTGFIRILPSGGGFSVQILLNGETYQWANGSLITNNLTPIDCC